MKCPKLTQFLSS